MSKKKFTSGKIHSADSKISIISYDKDNLTESNNIESAVPGNASDSYIHWIDVNNLGDVQSIERIGEKLGLHHLIIEDILNSNQMVKLDNYDDCLFIVLKLIKFDPVNLNINPEHVSIVIKGNYLASFQEFGGDIFSPVKLKIKQGKDFIRKSGIDYLCYELIDAVVDNYFTAIDSLGDSVDDIEEELMSNPTKSTLQKIYFIKRELMYLRKSIFPLRELIGSLTRYESGVIRQGVIIYLRDVYDHLIQIVDTVETYHDILSNMLDTYLSSIANKTNDIMKVLTIFSAIFIPLTFLAGVYGMNFKYIPELDFEYGYPMFWMISLIITAGMLVYFYKKKWF